MAIIAVIIAQMFYTVSDTWKKVIFNARDFSLQTLLSPAFLLAMTVALIGFLFQMYALSKIELSRTIITLGMSAVVFSAAAGVFYLKEHLNYWNWLGVTLALIAIFLVNVK